MALTKYKLGDLIELVDERNSNLKYDLNSVRGISIQKIFIPTKADMEGVSLAPYILVEPDSFAYVPVTSRNGGKITIAHNTTEKTFIVSSSYIVFKVSREEILLSDYLFVFFNRPEFDRYARFHSWGSARETFSWSEMCNVEINLPSLEIQRKFVAIYEALLANQKNYERGLDDLKLVCDGYIEDLRKKFPCEKIGSYIELSDERNSDDIYNVDDVRGISIDKKFIETKADMSDVSLTSYLLIEPENFAFVPVTSRNGGKISIAINNSTKTFICSSSYTVFSVKKERLLPRYLMLWLSRSEFDRYARFHSWGSARENFSFNDICQVEIPIPDMETQKSIASIYEVYQSRKKILEQLKAQIKNICPILVKGSLDEGKMC